MTLSKEQKQQIEEITKKWADRGFIMEGGWQAFVMTSLQGAPPNQVREMRKAYYLGAQHLFASIISILEPGTEPTDKDMKRMELILAELKRFEEEMGSSKN